MKAFQTPSEKVTLPLLKIRYQTYLSRRNLTALTSVENSISITVFFFRSSQIITEMAGRTCEHSNEQATSEGVLLSQPPNQEHEAVGPQTHPTPAPVGLSLGRTLSPPSQAGPHGWSVSYTHTSTRTLLSSLPPLPGFQANFSPHLFLWFHVTEPNSKPDHSYFGLEC